ncbi:hypothetical protein BDW71DRAFT_23789 [Aspergillus fruticulosus]
MEWFRICSIPWGCDICLNRAFDKDSNITSKRFPMVEDSSWHFEDQTETTEINTNQSLQCLVPCLDNFGMEMIDLFPRLQSTQVAVRGLLHALSAGQPAYSYSIHCVVGELVR